MVRTNKQVWRKKWNDRREPVNAFARTVLRRLGDGRGRTLLDVGCGIGRDSVFFATNGYRVTATDFSESGIAALEAGKQRRGLNMRTMLHDTSKRFPFPDGSFDIIYAHLSLHYFDDRSTRKVFAEMHRLLRKGGMFFVKCKSTDDAYYGKGDRVGPDTFRHGHVRHFFTKNYMTSVLQDFDILSLRRSSSFFHGKTSGFVAAIAKK